MSLRPPARYSASAPGGASFQGLNPLDHEIAGEKAASLGRAGERVETCLAALRAVERGDPRRAGLLREYAIKDAMIAATHAALAAQSFGLGSTFMNGWREDAVKAAIGAADRPEIAIAVLLPVGYPLEVPRSPGRLPPDRTVATDRLAP